MSGTNIKKYRYGHIVLNLLRAFNVIGLLMIAASSWILIVKSEIQNTFFFFEAMAHAATSLVAIFLIVTEFPLLKKYFANTWPVFTETHSFFWLGTAMLVMGFQVLGSLNRDDADIGILTLALWRLTLASGILAITFGAFNLVASLVWRVPSKGITARMIRDNGALAEEKMKDPSAYDFDQPMVHETIGRPVNRFNRVTMLFKKGHKPTISKPIVQHHDDDIEAAYPDHEDDRRESWEGRHRGSPIAPGIQRPPTALHPAYTGKSTTSSRYSVVSHINRF